jgi:succinate dehydrogenase/fumarate reductase flavoprotein subunit
MVSRSEARLLVRPFASRRAFAFGARSAARYARDRLRHRRGTRLLLGNALVAALLLTIRRLGVQIWTESPFVELIRNGSRVDGAVIQHNGRRTVVSARRGVVLATGGFTSDAHLRQQFAPDRPSDWALSTTGATGDGMTAAREVGGVVDTGDGVPMFFMPASVMRRRDGESFAFPHIISDRARPGLIAVDATGHRFVNEADSYHDFVLAMYRNGTPAVAFLVCDQRSLRNYGIGLIRPVWQWLRWYEKAGYLVSAGTLAELADCIGVDRDALARAVRRHNDDARTGTDTAFGKGSNALNRFNGDPGVQPNPCLAPIETAPFYAVRVVPAAIGASAGLATDGDARVLDAAGAPIEGLYACGNDQASIMRGAYPGPGITLGPAITFAYRAMEHACHAPVPTTESA